MTDPRAWVRAHNVSWEIEPLRETIRSRGVTQTGYELRLFGMLDVRAKEDAVNAVLHFHAELRGLALRLLHSIPEPHAVIEVRPFEGSVHFRPEAPAAVEIELAVVAYPWHPGQTMPEREAQQRIVAVEEKLLEAGLRRRPFNDLLDHASTHVRLRA
jgi:hypothetical protein